MFEVRVPASTSNLGAGFDCFGLGLQLYLTVKAVVEPELGEPCLIESRGEGENELACGADNLIYRAMSFAARREGWALPPVRLAVENEIPLGRGLGSSAAAIVAGIFCGALVCGKEIADDVALNYALEMEGHADNVAAAVYGGLTVACISEDGRALVLKRSWPRELKVIAVLPDAHLKTSVAREALPREVAFKDAVHNLQRAALFCAAIETGAYPLLWEAMQDRLHQRHRESFVPGLAEALAMPKEEGLVGLALSGSGPSIIALALDRFLEIGEKIADNFQRHGIGATVRLLEVDNEGRKISV
ncbi:MAG TPA: homoserine kinase [Pyrinomonadaceae bacterium]